MREHFYQVYMCIYQCSLGHSATEEGDIGQA